MNSRFDVIIIGAGPAGSIAAYQLCNKGVKVLLLEKCKMPRYKICGGGVQSKILKFLPFDILPVTQKSISKLAFTYKFKDEFIRFSENPLMYCYMRDEFDNFLLHKAIEKGCYLIDGIEIKNISENNYITVTTENDIYTSDYLIGADGAHSFTSKSLNFKPYDYSSFAIEAELYPDEKTYEMYSDAVRIDWGTVHGGYAWIFPKNEHLSVGAGALFPGVKNIKQYFDFYLKTKNIKKEDIKSLKTSILPHRISNKKIFSDYSVLIGDAAGLVDPFSGEGINNAIKSGLIAGNFLFDLLDLKQKNISLYQKEIDNQILQENITGHEMRLLFNFIPKISHNLLKSNNIVWNAMSKIFFGDKYYSDVKKKFGLFWEPSVLISKYLTIKRKNKTFRN